jgi:hypothetical protein
MRIAPSFAAAIGILALPAALLAQTARAAAPASDAAYIRKAEGGAPSSISKDARIARFDKDGKVSVLRDGSNDFTCASIPQMGIPAYCGDKNAWDWMTSAMSRKDKPSNNEPGIAYMMQGGVHYETADGQIEMMPSAKTHNVKEPPHWMLMWPMDPAKTGLPTRPNASGAYVMFAGTPYAHIMVYENPARMKTLAGKGSSPKS